ncbi:MAG: archease [bacterium]
MPHIQQIDHTGDIGLIVTAESLIELFEHSAFAMFEIIGEMENVQPVQQIGIEVQADDLERLFVRWLSELNFRHITEEMLFCKFKINGFFENKVTAEIWGETIDPKRHIVHTEIKAVTYHHLRVEHKDDAWEAQFIFDM